MTEPAIETKRTPLWKFVAPRHWPLWLGIAVLRAMHYLPFAVQLSCGRVLGRLSYRLSRSRRNVALTNFRLCFPDRSAQEHVAMCRDHFENLGMSLFEMTLAWWASDASLRKRVRFEGLEHLERARSEYSSLIILSGHFMSIELGGRFLKLHFPVFDGMYRPHRNPFFDELVRRGRLRAGRALIEKSDIKTMIRNLRQGISVWYAPDQNYRRKYAELIDFFGEPAMTNTATGRVATLGHAGILPFFCRREGNTTRYVVEILPPLIVDKDDPVAVTRDYVGLLEDAIRKAPGQYFWVHRRFKARPAPLGDPYRDAAAANDDSLT